MNHFAFDEKTALAGPSGAPEVAVADTAGMVWGHSNPAELYRWIALRNNLLSTIAVAFTHNPSALPRPLAG